MHRHHKNDNSFTWEQFKQGNKEILNTIFKKYYDDLYNYGLKLRNNPEFVKDTIQDLFLKLWNNRNNLSNVAYIKPYLLKSFRRVMIDKLKTDAKYILQGEASEDKIEIEFSIEDFIIDNELNEEKRNYLINVLNDLPDKQKETIYLRYFEGFDYDEISKIMKVNIQSVRNNLYRAISLLKNKLLFFVFLSSVSYEFFDI